MNLEFPDAPHLRIKALAVELAKAVAELEFENGPAPLQASERWIPTAEACERLGITRQTLLRYKARGLLKTARIGRSDRYSTRELDALPEIIQRGPWK